MTFIKNNSGYDFEPLRVCTTVRLDTNKDFKYISNNTMVKDN